MVVPSLRPYSPPFPFASTPSFSETLILQTLPSTRCPPLFAVSSAASIPCTEAASYGLTVLLLPGTSSSTFSDHISLSFPSSFPPSFPLALAMARPRKRLCKIPQALNCRSRVFVSDGTRLGPPADDGSLLHHTYRGVEKSSPRRMKTAEELHFEAIQDYYLRYEKEDGYCHVNDAACGVAQSDTSSPEASQSSERVHAAVVGVYEAHTPVDEVKYVDACEGVSPWRGDQNSLYSLANGLEAVLQKEEKRTPLLDDVAEPILSIEVPQSSVQADRKSAEGKKQNQVKPAISSPRQSSASMPPQAFESATLQNSTVMVSTTKRHENSLIKDEDMENTKYAVPGDLSEEQKIRMELNKAAALARRNMRRCEEVVLETQGKGLSYPKFENLLLDKSWVEVLGLEFQKPYMERLHQFVSQEAAGRIPIYPPPAKLFNAFNSCPFDKVKVVIIGQDPYHGPGQAMGLCFSVEKGTKLPSSLSNIFLEIESDLCCDFPVHGNLEKWTHQGVLLLNTVLTVRDHHANSHAKKGWEFFTDAAIRALAQQRSDIVFLLWGNQAQEKLRLINKTSHHILKASHPSGISAHRGFFKCRHFSKTNQILVDQGSLPIDWQL